MQAVLAPLLAGGGAAAGATATAGLASGLSALAPIASGIGQYQSGKSQEEMAKINSFIGRTRAIQTNVAAREGLNEELGTMRATLAANQQKQGVGTMEVFNELRQVRGRERRIEFGNRMQEASQQALAGRNAGAGASQQLLGGFIKASPSLFDMYQLNKRR
jgi:hypothetical protein